MHASFTLSDETLDRCGRVAAELGAGFHVHTAEAASDAESCRREHGMSIVHRWNHFGILKAKSLLAHCVHVDDHDIEELRVTQTNVIHNPQSNMGNAVGCAPVLEMMRRGVRVGLGTDGYTPDMFESMKAANLLLKHDAGDPRVAWAEPPQMLFQENARIATECFGRPVGKLVPGAHADIILVNYDPPTPMSAENLNGHIHFGFTGGAVETVLIGGQIVDGIEATPRHRRAGSDGQIPRRCRGNVEALLETKRISGLARHNGSGVFPVLFPRVHR